MYERLICPTFADLWNKRTRQNRTPASDSEYLCFSELYPSPTQQKSVHRDHYSYFMGLPSDMPCTEDNRRRLDSLRYKRLGNRVAPLESPREPASRYSRPSSAPSSKRASGTFRQMLEEKVSNIRRQRDTRTRARQKANDMRNRQRQSVTLAKDAMIFDQMRNDLCLALRYMAFGSTDADLMKFATLPCKTTPRGTREEVAKVVSLWVRLDEDRSGSVELSELLTFFQTECDDRLSGMLCAKSIQCLHRKKRRDSSDSNSFCPEISYTVEDILRMIWMRATDADVKAMMHDFYTVEFERDRVPTPPVLSSRKRESILSNFPAVNWDQRPSVTFEELIKSSTVCDITMRDVWSYHGKSLADYITKDELLTLHCPHGYRLATSSKTAFDTGGRPIMYVSNKFASGWYYGDGQASIRLRRPSFNMLLDQNEIVN